MLNKVLNRFTNFFFVSQFRLVIIIIKSVMTTARTERSKVDQETMKRVKLLNGKQILSSLIVCTFLIISNLAENNTPEACFHFELQVENRLKPAQAAVCRILLFAEF